MAVGSCPLMRQICLGTTLPALRFHASGSIRCKVHFAPAKCWGFSVGVMPELMSAFGTKRTSMPTLSMSAFSGKADTQSRRIAKRARRSDEALHTSLFPLPGA